MFHENYSLWDEHQSNVNPSIARVLDGVLKGDCNFCVCGRNPTMWPFKWKLPACTFTCYFLFFKILENEIWKSGRNLALTTFAVKGLILSCYLLYMPATNSCVFNAILGKQTISTSSLALKNALWKYNKI